MMTRLPLRYATSDTDTHPSLIFISFFFEVEKKNKTNKDNQSKVPFPVDTAIVSRFQASF